MDSDVADLLKILVPALGAWAAAWLTNRRDRRQWTEKHEADQKVQLSAQAERLAAGWSEMTTQAREIIARLQVETIDAKTRCSLAEGKVAALERDLAEVRARYEAALAALEELQERGTRRGPRPRITED